MLTICTLLCNRALEFFHLAKLKLYTHPTSSPHFPSPSAFTTTTLPFKSLTILFIYNCIYLFMAVLGFPGGSVVKNPPAKAGDTVSIPGLGRSPGEGNGNPLQYSCLENPMDRGAWWATVHRVTESDTTKRLNNNISIQHHLPISHPPQLSQPPFYL